MVPGSEHSSPGDSHPYLDGSERELMPLLGPVSLKKSCQGRFPLLIAHANFPTKTPSPDACWETVSSEAAFRM